MEKVDASFLEPFLIDPELLSWSPSSGSLDLTKRVIEVFHIFKEEPLSLTEETVRSLVWDKDSQIGNKDAFFAHILNVAYLYRQIVDVLLSLNPELDLPEPNIAWVRGIVHDMNAIYSKYQGKFRQEDKQLTLYFHSRHLGLDDIANHVAMHCGYWEVLEMIRGREDLGFIDINLYNDWIKTLNNPKNHLYFEKIESYFDLFLKGEDNLPLIVLTIADHLEGGKPSIDLKDFDKNYIDRMGSIVTRYYLNQVLGNQVPTPLGYALMKKGGLERSVKYKEIVKDLLEGNFGKYKGYNFWR